MIWSELLAETIEKLRPVVDSAEFDARQICFEASGLGAAQWHEVDRSPVTKKAVASVDSMVERRLAGDCLLYTSPSPRDRQKSRMPSSA